MKEMGLARRYDYEYRICEYACSRMELTDNHRNSKPRLVCESGISTFVYPRTAAQELPAQSRVYRSLHTSTAKLSGFVAANPKESGHSLVEAEVWRLCSTPLGIRFGPMCLRASA